MLSRSISTRQEGPGAGVQKILEAVAAQDDLPPDVTALKGVKKNE